MGWLIGSGIFSLLIPSLILNLERKPEKGLVFGFLYHTDLLF